jgi:hypothetical protein
MLRMKRVQVYVAPSPTLQLPPIQPPLPPPHLGLTLLVLGAIQHTIQKNPPTYTL